MRTRAIATIAMVASAALLVSVGSVSAATLRTGDILVANANSSDAAVVIVDPRTGQQSALTNNAISPTDLLIGTYDLVLDRFGRLFVVDFSPQVGDSGVFRVDVRTGAQSAVSTGDNLQNADGLDLQPDGKLLVVDDVTKSVVRVDPSGGSQTVVSDNTISGPDLFDIPYDLALAPSGTIFVANPGPSASAIIQVDPRTGQQSLFSTNAISGPDLFDTLEGVEVIGRRNLLVTDDQAFADSNGGLIGVAAGSGQQSEVASNAQPGPDLFFAPHRTTIDLAGKYLVVDYLGPDGLGSIIRVEPSTGLQSLVSDNPTSSEDLFEDPASAIVVPPKCGGQYPTIYGTPGKDALRGTRFPDVIAGLAGRDKILGLKGKDRLCGGKGRDRLIGGKGRDLLRGGPGRDRQRQ